MLNVCTVANRRTFLSKSFMKCEFVVQATFKKQIAMMMKWNLGEMTVIWTAKAMRTPEMILFVKKGV